MAAARGAWPLAATRGWVLHPRTAVPPARAIPTTIPGRRRQAAAAAAFSSSSSAADDDWQQRSRLLFEARGLDALSRTRVLVVGLGGVGSYAAEALVRAGVGAMTIVDGDSVDATNRNRQLLALKSTVGRPKAEVMAERLLDVNPNLRLTVLQRFLDPGGAAGLVVRPPQHEEDGDGDGGGSGSNAPSPPYYDFVLDCIDSIAPKVALIAAAARSGSRVVAAMGAGGRVDPSRVRLVDAAHTQGDALGRAVRKGLKKAGVLLAGGDDMEKGGRGSRRSRRGKEDEEDDDGGATTTTTTLFRPPPGAIVCVFSDEPARRASLKEARSPANPYKVSYFGTSSYVPATFGLVAASAVVRTIGDGAAMRDLLWVPPSVIAAKENAKKKKQRASEQRRRAAAEAGGEGQPQRRREAAAATTTGGSAGGGGGGGGEETTGQQQPEDPQAARLRAWADRTLPAAGGAFEI